MFEPLDEETASFFEKGELPDSLKAQHDTSQGTPPVANNEPALEPPPVAPAATPPAGSTPPADPPPPSVGDEVVWDEPVAGVPNPAIVSQLLDRQQKTIEELAKQVKALTEKNAPGEQDIDPTVDPLGALMQQQERIRKQIEQLTQKQENDARNMGEAEKVSLIQRHVESQVAAFSKDHADYPQAFKFVANARLAQYKELGFSQQEAHAALDQDNNLLVQKALQTGRNPAEVVYKLAKQFGYKGAAPAQQSQNPPEKTLEAVRRANQTSASLERSVPPGTTNITASSLKDMSERELDRVVRDEWDTIFGRNKGDI